MAKDSERAAAMKVDDPATLICVRSPVLNSRTRFEKKCMTSDQWKAYALERDAQTRERKEGGR
ncbi:MAG: hypothetical protein ACR2FJ_05575 [Qipengyuania sp.]